MSSSVVPLDGSCNPELVDGETILLSVPNCKLIKGESAAIQGHAHVTSQQLVFVDASNVEAGEGWNFRKIALHAIAQPSEGFPFPSVYIQTGEGGQEDDEMVYAEMRLVPELESMLQPLYEKLSEGAAMNPDPVDPMDESDDDEADAAWAGKLDTGKFQDAPEENAGDE